MIGLQSRAMSGTELPMQQTRMWFSFEIFEKITKASIVLVAVLYSLGLLVSMQHLMALGVSDFSSLRPKYIATGAWTLLLFLLAAFPALMPAIALFFSPPPKWSARVGFAFFLVFATAFGIAITFEHFLLKSLGIPLPYSVPREVFSLTYTVTLTTFLCLFMWIDSYGRPASRRYLILISVYIIPSTIFFTTHDYLQNIYVQVPEALGGGKPTIGELILNKDGIVFWRQARLFAGTAPESSSTGQVKILYQSEREFVLQAPYGNGNGKKDRIVIMNKSLVDGVLPASE